MSPVSFGQSFSRRLPAVSLAAFVPLSAVACLAAFTGAVAMGQEVPSKGQASTDKPAAAQASRQEADSNANEAGWKPLRGSWVVSQFGGDGPVEIGQNLIQFGLGDPLTGIRWEGELLRENYEIELEARRTDGFDFFCGLTFPVGEDNVSFILGGWGGGVVGISSIDGRDASENDTTSFRSFNNEQWYKVRVRVDPYRIRGWIDDKEAVSQPRKGHEFDIRYEMDPCVPLGLAAFQCKAELRGIRIRKLSEQELAEAKKNSEEPNP